MTWFKHHHESLLFKHKCHDWEHDTDIFVVHSEGCTCMVYPFDQLNVNILNEFLTSRDALNIWPRNIFLTRPKQ